MAEVLNSFSDMSETRDMYLQQCGAADLYIQFEG